MREVVPEEPADRAGIQPGDLDPYYRCYGNYAQIENGVGMTRYLIEQWKTGQRRQPRRMNQPRKVTLVTSAMARPVIEGFASDLRAVPNLEVQVVPIVNQFFGPEVTVAGLLCPQDVLKMLNEQENLGDLVLLPRVMLDNEGKHFPTT